MAVSLICPFYVCVSRFLVSAYSLLTFACMPRLFILLFANWNCARSGFGRAKLKQVLHFQEIAVKKKGSLSFSSNLICNQATTFILFLYCLSPLERSVWV
jgi:hypothetical protein